MDRRLAGVMLGMRCALAGVVAGSLIGSPAPGAAAAAPKQRAGVVTVEVDIKAPAGAKEVRLWIPYPVSDAHQEIAEVSVSGTYTSSAVHQDASGSSLLYAEWRGGAPERRLTYSFAARRTEVVNPGLAAADGPAAAAGHEEFLDLAWLGPTEQKIRRHAAEITKGRSTTLDKARAVYDWIVENMRRDPDAKACGLCDVERLLAERTGKCADVHTVFVALCRAAGIPARDIWGIRMPKEAEGEMTAKQHCWAEFHLPGRGWVPVDAADVHKIVFDRKLSPEEARKLPEREYFFGNLDANRIQLGTAHGLLTPPQQGPPLVYFMYPYAEADGRQIGTDINSNFGYKITFRER